MKTLPYFRWYPADAESDEAYAAMNDTELGFFHRCLNKSWINGSLPDDPDQLGRLMKVSRPYLDKVWAKVGMCYEASIFPGRLVNPRQERERVIAIEKGEKNKRVGNTNASRKKRERVLIASVPERVPNANGTQHAQARPDSVSVSGSCSQKFSEFWKKYPRKFGETDALGDWVSVVTDDVEAAVFACLDRYLASDEVKRGVVMSAGSTMRDTGWLVKCSRDGWACEWPTTNGRPAKVDRTMELIRQRDAEEADRGAAR